MVTKCTQFLEKKNMQEDGIYFFYFIKYNIVVYYAGIELLRLNLIEITAGLSCISLFTEKIRRHLNQI